MARIIEERIKAQFADAVFIGDKTFEIRNNEEGYQKGDILKFRVDDSYWVSLTHPLNDKLYEITYVLSGWGLAEGYVALAIRPYTEPEGDEE